MKDVMTMAEAEAAWTAGQAVPCWYCEQHVTEGEAVEHGQYGKVCHRACRMDGELENAGITADESRER